MNRSLDELDKMTREQQQLRDETFRDRQRQSRRDQRQQGQRNQRPGQQGQQGQQGQESRRRRRRPVAQGQAQREQNLGSSASRPCASGSSSCRSA